MVNCYNYRISIIFGVFFAAGWMQLSRAESKSDEKIDYLVKNLERVRMSGLVPEGGINHFKSWVSWNATTDKFKLRCVREFERKLTHFKTNMPNENQALEDTDILGALAYAALDLVIRGSARWMKELVGGNEILEAGIDQKLNEGQLIHLCAFVGDQLSEQNLKSTMKRFKQSNPSMSREEAVGRMLADFLLVKFV